MTYLVGSNVSPHDDVHVSSGTVDMAGFRVSGHGKG